MKSKSRAAKKQTPSKVAEAPAAYPALKSVIHELRHSDFQKICQASPFSLSEWARMLHLSERTLQRHEQQQGSLSPIHAERALQIEELVKQGVDTFGDAQIFYQWLQSEPPSIKGVLSLNLLQSYQGIEAISQQLHRIQQGIFA